LIELPVKVAGACALAVFDPGKEIDSKRVASVAVEVKQGTVAAVAPDTDAQPTWALGTPDAWFEAMIEDRRDALRISGIKPGLAQSIVKALHNDLFRFGGVRNPAHRVFLNAGVCRQKRRLVGSPKQPRAQIRTDLEPWRLPASRPVCACTGTTKQREEGYSDDFQESSLDRRLGVRLGRPCGPGDRVGNRIRYL